MEEHPENYIPDRMEEDIKKGTVSEEETTKFFRDGKDTMPVCTGNEFKRHVERTHLVVFVTTGRAESAATAESNEFHPATMRTAVKSPAFGIIATIDHFGDILNDGSSGTQFIKDVFVIIRKNRL